MAIVGDATIKLGFDGSSLTASMNKTEKQITSKSATMGESGGKAMSAAWGIGIGAVSGITHAIVEQAIDILTSGIDKGIQRLDTLNNFPRVMENLGVETSKSKKVIDDLGNRLKGLPTSLDAAAQSVQRFTTANGDIEKSEEYFLALNNALLAGGTSMDIQQTALEQLSQAYAKGKPDMMEWRSLMTAMPAQLKQVSKAMGFASTDALGESLRKGETSMDQFMSKLAEMNKEGSKDFKSFEKQAKAATGGIQTAQANLGTAMARGWAKIFDAIGSETLVNAITGVADALEGVLKWISDLFARLKENTTVMEALKTVLTIIGAALQAIGWIFSNIIAPAIEFAITLVAAFINLFADAIPGIGTMIQAIGEWFNNVIIGIRDGFLSAVNAIKGWFKGLFDFFSGIANGIIGLFKNIGIKVGEMVSGAFKGLVNGIIGAAENFLNVPIRGINGLLDVINAVPGVDIARLNELHFPRLAKGGVTTGSTFANIGEAGAEAVIPLERNTDTWAAPLARAIADQFSEQGIGGAGGITVYMTNNINNNLDADEIGQRLMTSIRRAA